MTCRLRATSRHGLSVCRDGKRLAPAVLALALAVPGGAHPCSVEQLLRLPLERLLQLEISPRRLGPALTTGVPPVRPAPNDRGPHEA